MTPRVHTLPMRTIPAWAVLQRRLFDEIETAWRLFADRFTEHDGRLRFAGRLEHRDGVDDFYEPFFNWPAFYSLGGSDDVLLAAKRHWNGITAQLAEAGMLTDEFENGYDWFHQGESLLFFYGLCAADPDDAEFAARARRFAELYSDPSRGNYDPDANIIRAPHTGARGALPGLGSEWQSYSAGQDEMRIYGLPLEYVPGIETWDDLRDPEKARLMGQTMQRLAAGDVPVNLAATSLVANRWLYDGDEAAAAWIVRYADGWWARAQANGGVVPDNVSPDGETGGRHGGRWYGGHYGWTWPHGLPSVGMGVVIGGINAAMVSGDDRHLDAARAMLDTVLDNAEVISEGHEIAFGEEWRLRLGSGTERSMTLVPHRFGRQGWFDHGPMKLDLPTWIWWWSRREDDWSRLRRVMAGYPEPDAAVMSFRDKEEAGHEAPWISFLAGELPDYPEQALSMALAQVARRVALIEATQLDADADHLHFWQRVNPVVTEILGQLISGTPQTLYNGGLPFAAVSYRDADRDRPGLPQDVAALVRRIDDGSVALELANLSMTHTRRVRISPSRFGQQRITAVESRGERGDGHPGASTSYGSLPGTPFTESFDLDARDVLVEIPPSHRVDLVLHVADATTPPSHRGRAS